MPYEFDFKAYVRHNQKLGTLITVSGGKGGTGKTNISVNLAVALAQRKRNVVLLDADIGLANAEVIMGIKSPQNLQSVIEGRHHIMDILTVGPLGIKVAPGVSGLGHLANLDKNGQQKVRIAMEELQNRFDYVIVDTMAGIGPSSVAFAVAADQVLLVTAPEPSAMVDAYAMIKMIHQLNTKADIGVLVNMSDDQAQAARTFNKLGAAAAKYLSMTLDYAGHIPTDPVVRKAVVMAHPFLLLYPEAPASMAIQRLAAGILAEPAPVANPKSKGFFRKFATTLGIAQ